MLAACKLVTVFFLNFQGFHDICVTFLLILGQDLSFLVVNALSKSHLRLVCSISALVTILSFSIQPTLSCWANVKMLKMLKCQKFGQ